MFKTLSQQTKETMMIIMIAGSILVLFLVNLVVLVPTLLSVYKTSETAKNAQTIDAETVNKAIEYLQ